MLQPVEKLAGLPFITLSKKSFNDENINNKLAITRENATPIQSHLVNLDIDNFFLTIRILIVYKIT